MIQFKYLENWRENSIIVGFFVLLISVIPIPKYRLAEIRAIYQSLYVIRVWLVDLCILLWDFWMTSRSYRWLRSTICMNYRELNTSYNLCSWPPFCLLAGLPSGGVFCTAPWLVCLNPSFTFPTRLSSHTARNWLIKAKWSSTTSSVSFRPSILVPLRWVEQQQSYPTWEKR